MGMHNKERRRAKKSARARARREANRSGSGGFGPHTPTEPRYSSTRDRRYAERFARSERERVEILIREAAHAPCEDRSDGDDLFEMLVECFPPALVTEQLESDIVGMEAHALRNGWEPVDLLEVTRRQAGAAATGLLAGLLDRAVSVSPPAGDGTGREAQCASVEGRRLDPSSGEWRSGVEAAIRLIGTLDHLHPLKSLAPPHDAEPEPETGRRAMLSKIRALLAKAESTEFAEEADAYTTKATELMRRHRINRAALAASTRTKSSAVASRRCWIDKPYVDAKSLLLDAVAAANGCRAVGDRRGFVTLVGTLGDIETTELLFTSLLAQATRQMTIAGRTTPDEMAATRERVASALGLRSAIETLTDLKGIDGAAMVDNLESFFVGSIEKRKRNPSFRRTFLVAFASRIESRLAEVEQTVTEAATAELGRDFLPVLAREQQIVDDAVRNLFGDLGYYRIRATDKAGWAAGTAAADLADLNVLGELRTG